MPSDTSQGRTDAASRVISATPRALYRAFADPTALMAWLPPGDMTGRALAYDFREGGAYRIELTYGESTPSSQGKSTARSDVSAGRFVALEPDRRIVQTVRFESTDAAFAGEMTMSWLFEPVSEGTRVSITARDVPPGISAADHAQGMRDTLEKLARYLERRG